MTEDDIQYDGGDPGGALLTEPYIAFLTNLKFRVSI